MSERDWLDGIDVATPCSADWSDMQGDDRCRFCAQCRLHVFDLSAMSRERATALVAERLAQPGQRLCVRFRRRADGTVLTRDCPVGLRARLRRAAGRFAAALVALLTFGGCRHSSGPDGPVTGPVLPIDAPEMGEIAAPVMGDFVAPLPPAAMGTVPAPESGQDRPK